MTTYGEAFQMGLSANLAVGILNEVNCAGEALARFALANVEGLSDETKKTVSHVLNHLSAVRELTEAFDEYITESVETFNEENPGKLVEVSKEVSEAPVIAKMQDILGMTQEQRVARIKQNLGQLIKEAQEAGEAK